MRANTPAEWSEDNEELSGLPRPYAKFGNGLPNPFNFPPKTPIPWQSMPNLAMGILGLNIENEKKVWKESLCPYCGLGFEPEETSIRWTTIDKPITLDGSRVFSDLHPLHMECMRQARIFCPHMKTTKDTEFEIGPFNRLKEAAKQQLLNARI